MKPLREAIPADLESSFRIMLNPNLNEYYYWHFHPEYEIVYVEAEQGFRHIGDHISKWTGSDLAFIGPNIPHLNFDYGSKTAVDTVVVQMKEDFLGAGFFSLPEMKSVQEIFDRSRKGLAFSGETKLEAGRALKGLAGLQPFERMVTLLQLLRMLSSSNDIEDLHVRALAMTTLSRQQRRINEVYQYVENNYQQEVDIHDVAAQCHLTTSAFCRYFKQVTKSTFTQFLNQYRVKQAQKLLLQDKNVTEACYECGFANISYFNKTFKKITGENPSHFRRRQLLS
ncbi:MAG TPA: AraC family transcriptional regulator [Chitinophagaceae bacterium]